MKRANNSVSQVSASRTFSPLDYTMNPSNSSFGIYETARIVIPGLYFASLLSLFYLFYLHLFIPLENSPYLLFLIFVIIAIVSGLTMYAKETTKRRRAFTQNQPSSYLQNISRRLSSSDILNDSEAQQLYLYILNNYIPAIFHDKIFFFGTIYHIMIQIRRTSLWFAVLSSICILFRTVYNIPFADQIALILLCIGVWLIYFLNVEYNKADKKMQNIYQDQIFWLQMNENLILELLKRHDISKKGR